MSTGEFTRKESSLLMESNGTINVSSKVLFSVAIKALIVQRCLVHFLENDCRSSSTRISSGVAVCVFFYKDPSVIGPSTVNHAIPSEFSCLLEKTSILLGELFVDEDP